MAALALAGVFHSSALESSIRVPGADPVKSWCSGIPVGVLILAGRGGADPFIETVHRTFTDLSRRPFGPDAKVHCPADWMC